MKKIILHSLFLLLTIFHLLTPKAFATQNIGTITPNQTTIGAYEKFEITFDINGGYTNPYDPADIDVIGVFTAPSGHTESQIGFYYQNYTDNHCIIVGNPTWKIRYTPIEVGEYKYVIKVTTKSGLTQSSEQSFTVTTSSNVGFLQVSQTNKRYFEFSKKGDLFLGNGLNIAYLRPKEDDIIGQYSSVFSKMKENNINTARIWYINELKDEYAGWILNLQKNKLGQDYKLDEAWAFDKVMEMAERNGIYIDLTFIDVNQHDTDHWNSGQNLYSKSNGGPATQPCDVFTNPTANMYQQRAFRYMVARWGYSTKILMWELFNEVNNMEYQCTNWSRDAMVDWHVRMSNYIKSIDNKRHIISTSTDSHTIHPYLYGKPELEVAKMNFYHKYPANNDFPNDCSDYSECMKYKQWLVYTTMNNTPKPSYINEHGVDDSNANPLWIHEANWASIMSGRAAGGFVWHWFDYITKPEMFTMHKGIGAYLNNGQGIKKDGLQPLHAVNYNIHYPDGTEYQVPPYTDNWPTNLSSSNPKLRVMGLQSADTSAYVWIMNKDNLWSNTNNTYQSGTVEVKGLVPQKAYSVEKWDTFKGTIINTTTISADSSGAVLLNIQNLNRDVAYKIIFSNLKCSIRGDFNNDCKVNFTDLSMLLNKFGSTRPEDLKLYNLDKDKTSIGVSDLLLLLSLITSHFKP